MLVGSGVTVGIGVGWAVLGVGCVVAVVVGCGVLIGVLVAVRVSVCDGTGTLAGVVVILVTALSGIAPGATLEEVMAFGAVAPTSARVPLSNAQALADEVPMQLEGTRTFNYKL